MLILPLAIPSYITAYAYAGVFDYGGSLKNILSTFNISYKKIDIMNIYGLIFILSLSLFPYIYVSARAVFLYQSKKLIEASKNLGASEISTFFRIVLPVARPAIVGGIALMLMEVLNDYGAAKYYGVSTFTTGIFRSWFSLGEPGLAIYLSALLLLVIFSILYLERLQRRKKGYAISGKSDTPLTKIKLTRAKQIALTVITCSPILLGFLIPVLQLIYWSLLTYKEVASYSFFITALQSLGVSTIAALLTIIIALATLFFPKWNRISGIKSLSKITIVGYAIPGAVIAIGVMIPGLALNKWLVKLANNLFNIELGLFLSETITLLLYAYIIRFLAVAYNPIEGSFKNVNKSVSESSRILGKNNLKTFFKIEMPLIKPGIISAFILVFVDIMKELPLTLILKPYNINTLAVKAYEYASDEQIMEAALPSICIIITGIIPIIILNKLILKS